ncbi:MAG TPA: HlyD family efflux transporter periplasmic adaptor subunit, partial [Pyrinomonadaceae bacterium]
YNDLKAQLESQTLAQQAQVNAAESASAQADLQEEADEKLAKDGLIPELDLKLSRLRAEQLGKTARIERDRFLQSKRSSEAQLAAQRARVNQMQALYALRRRQVESLKVRAGIAGVLQELPVQVGQSVNPGTVLARVAQPTRLKAELRIPEVMAKDVLVGQSASIDTRNGVIPGHVIRIDPAAEQGTVTVDVALDGALPQGARPDLSVDGTIELERLENVLYVGRPAFGQAQSTVGMFRLEEGGKAASRVQVRLGRSSVNTIEILEGLKEGDEVILSDTAAWDNYNRVVLK